MPNLRVLATCCVRLELRSLPSTSVTRLQRYYEPLRHPRAPGLSVTGVRLVVPDHALGLPVLPALSLCTCCRHYPGAATGLVASLIHPVVSAFPGMAAGSACASTFSRLARRSLALRPAHSRRHQFVTLFTRRLQPYRYLHDRSGCFRLEPWPGGVSTHRKTPPFHGAHPLEPFTTGSFQAFYFNPSEKPFVAFGIVPVAADHQGRLSGSSSFSTWW